MREAVKALLFRGHKIEDRGPAPFRPWEEKQYAMQIRVKLDDAATMEDAEKAAEEVLAPLTDHFLIIESEIYEY